MIGNSSSVFQEDLRLHFRSRCGSSSYAMANSAGLPRGILGPRADYEFGAPQFHTQPSAGCHFYTNYR